MAATNTEFLRVDKDQMPAAVRKHWDAFIKARDAFETAMTKAMQRADTIPAGQEPRYSYKLGALFVGFTDPAEKAQKAKPRVELFG